MRKQGFSEGLGFTLIELSIVLVMVGLIIAGGISSWGAYLDNARQNHTQSNLEQTKRAMLDYVMVNFYMPCPDTDGDGLENRTDSNGDGVGDRCTLDYGTVPYDDIGRSKADTSDDYGNVFAYGVNGGVVNISDMSSFAASAYNSELEGARESSYFANQNVVDMVQNANSTSSVSLPFFGLDTPVTASTNLSGYTDLSYQVCQKNSGTLSSCTAADIEVKNIPAVLVAFNENGGNTSLNGCGFNNWSLMEQENCDLTNDRALMRNVFSDGEYDDQIVTISSYEIKQQVLDRLGGLVLRNNSEYAGYELIVRDNVSNANTTNLGTQGDESFYVDTNDSGDTTNSGNLDVANLQMKAGDDKLYIKVDIVDGGGADMGAGNDYTYVGGWVNGNLYLDTGNDKAELFTGVGVTGDFDAGPGDDVVSIGGTLEGEEINPAGATISGELLMGDEADELRIYGTENLVVNSSAEINGGAGNDILQIDINQADFESGGSSSIAANLLSRVWGFETIIFKDNSTASLDTLYGSTGLNYLPTGNP